MTARGIIQGLPETVAVQACSAVALFADLPDIDDVETPIEWIDRYGPTVRGSARMALVDMLATMDRVSVTRGSSGTDLIAWAVIGAADTLARHDAVPALMPIHIIDREPATPRVRNRKGASTPDVKRSRRADHASRVAMELARQANDILATAGDHEHSLMGGQTWHPREITPAMPEAMIDAVSEGWRKRPVKGRRMYCQSATGEYRWTERTAGDAERNRIVERDDQGKAIQIIDQMPKQLRITRQLTSTGIRNVTEEAAARRKAYKVDRQRASRGTDTRTEILALLATLSSEGASAAYRDWSITCTKAAKRKAAPTFLAQRQDDTLTGTPRSLATAILANTQ